MPGSECNPPVIEHRPVNRRSFFRQTTAAAAAALPLTAASYARVPGSNRSLRIAFLGCGARAQAHIHLVQKLARETGAVAAVAVCDVWDGLEETYEHRFGKTISQRNYSQGLYPSARKCGLDPDNPTHVVKDYRRLLDRKDVDAVCIATPDHWHGRMCLDAAAAGKDLFVEAPMTRTAAEAIELLTVLNRTERVCTVGIQSLADPIGSVVAERIQAGVIGPLVHVSAGVFRSDPRGQWRFYRLSEAMNPATIDWDLFLGHRFEVRGCPIGPTPEQCPFDAATFAQWRCDSRFSGGPFTDFYYHPVCRLLRGTGLRFPGRVAAAGGLFHEHDGRDVADVATIAADFWEGCQLLISGSTVNDTAAEEQIRGRLGSIRLGKGWYEIFREEATEKLTVTPPRNETEALWRDFLDCVGRRDRQTLAPPEIGAAAVVIVALAEQSLRTGRAWLWDAAQGRAVADEGQWLRTWLQRSRDGSPCKI